MKNPLKYFTAFLMVALLCVSYIKMSWAYVPPTVDPTIIMRDFEQEERPASQLEDIVDDPQAGPSTGEVSEEKAFVLKAVILEGSSVYQSADIAPFYQDMLNERVSFVDLSAIAQRITRKYREDGYIFSRAFLPPQKISDGVVHLSAIEGSITSVKVAGDVKDLNGTIQEMANKIRTSSIANTKEIERYLLLIDDLPGITAKSLIQPSATPGGGDLIISVEEDKFEGALGVDNRGSDTIGPYKGTLVGAFNSLFGIHDRTTLRGIVTSQANELLFGDITHEKQIGSEGLKVKGRAAFTSSEPGGNVRTLGIEGDSQLYDLEGSYPVIRSRQHNTNFIAGLGAVNSKTDLLGLTIGDDHIRSARVGIHTDFTDPYKGVNQLDVTVTQGLDILGATSDGLGRSRANGDHTFLKANVIATRVQELSGPLSLMVSGTAQLSRDPLLAAEEFTVGGQSFGRAYDAGEIAGDNGWAGIAELRYGGPVNSDILHSYQAYGYLDYGRVKNKSPVFAETVSDSLTSAGIGVRFNVAYDLSGYVELAKPINQNVTSEGDQGSRIFFSLTKRI